MTIQVDGKAMKTCPGWAGNDFRCGRGSPRLIREDADVCESCSRGMRKRGQTTREQEAQAERQRLAERERLEQGAELLRQKLGGMVAGSLFSDVLAAVASITQGDLGETWGYYADKPISAEDRFEILVIAFAGES